MFQDLETLDEDFPELARGQPVAITPVAERTTVRHKPTGRLYVVDNVSATSVGLSGIMGGRRLVSLDNFKDGEIWEVVHHGN